MSLMGPSTRMDETGVVNLLMLTKANLDCERLREVLRVMWKAGFDAALDQVATGYARRCGITGQATTDVDAIVERLKAEATG